MPIFKDLPLSVMTVKSFDELQDYLAKKSDQLEISKAIVIPTDIAQNQRMQTYRRLILAIFENKKLYLSSIKRDRGEDEFTLDFSRQKPDAIVFDEFQEGNRHSLRYDPDKFVELGLRQFMVYSQIQSLDFKDKRLVPLSTVVVKMWNGGAMIGGKEDPLEPCVSASTVIQHPFIFKGTEIPEYHVKIKPIYKCDRNMILVSACRMTAEEIGVPSLVVDTDEAFCATNTVIAMKIKPEFNNIGYLSRLMKFMLSQEFRKQLFPQRHDKLLLLSIKNLKMTMVPDPSAKNPEDGKLARAVETLKKADQELKERQRECDRLFKANG